MEIQANELSCMKQNTQMHMVWKISFDFVAKIFTVY